MQKVTGYLSRSWHDLIGDEGWWKPVLILTLVSFIPVVGSLIVLGYLLDWGREAAWGMNRGLPHKVGSVGKRLKWGFFAIIIELCWVIPVSIVGGILGVIPLIGGLIVIVAEVCVLVLSVIASAASVRMAVYDRIKGGLQFSRMLRMAKMDPSGLACCFGIILLSAVPILVGAILIAIGLIPTAGLFSLAGSQPSGMLSSGVAITAGIGVGLIGSVVALVLTFAIQFCSVLAQALAYRAFGYWVGQFQPSQWGGIEDPMPHEPGYRARTGATSFQDVAAAAGAAAATAGAYVREHAEQAAEAVSEAAAGFKAERVEPAQEPGTPGEPTAADEPLEAEVVSVDDAEAALLEEPAAEAPQGATEPESPTAEEPAAGTCPSCGTATAPGQKFCTECGAKLL